MLGIMKVVPRNPAAVIKLAEYWRSPSGIMGKEYLGKSLSLDIELPLERPKPGPLRRGNRVSVLDLYQIKGGRLCLYLLLDLDY
jgi:hypothetical protein